MNEELVAEIVKNSMPFNTINDAYPLIEKIKDKKIVMLGESSHGTQEFYEWRRMISNELIRKHGFRFIAVEGDWPSCLRVNDFIKGKASQNSISVMEGFSRWPTWMWANSEIMQLMDDLREWNENAEDPVGFYGLDVYSLYESLDEVLKKLERFGPELSVKVKALYSCLEPYRHDEREYARSLFEFPRGCEEEVVKALAKILKANLQDGEGILDIEQNARIVQNAEQYYHTMVSQREDSWNVRDRHMAETLDILLDHHGPDAKVIVWAHNTHIGDYRGTDMEAQGQINIGGLAREEYGEENVALIGFTTFKGKVIASHAWDGPIEIIKVPEGAKYSLEYAFHEAAKRLRFDNLYLDLSHTENDSPFNQTCGHRAIGVVYHPALERPGNYVPTKLSKRYDGMIFCNETRALKPLNVGFKRVNIPETYPFGSRI